MGTPHAAKADLRTELRALRRELPDRADRSQRIGRAVRELDVWGRAPLGRVMLFEALPGEPDLSALGEWCREQGREVVVPAQDPDPATVDLVIVPGVAFSPAGERLGQGGGWYDRFLARVGPQCVTVGVCFAAQVRATLPVEAHDIAMDHVVTEDGRIGPDGSGPAQSAM